MKLRALFLVIFSTIGANMYLQSQELGCSNGFCYAGIMNYETFEYLTAVTSGPNTYSVYVEDWVSLDYMFQDVKAIDQRAFNNYNNINNVILPSGLTYIGDAAFAGCTSLSYINIPSNVNYIGSSAFFNCNISSVTIPSGVSSIKNGTFESCDNLSSVSLPNNLKSIETNAFAYCRGLSSISVPNSVESFGSFVFSGCTSLVLVTLPVAIKTIPKGIFQTCRNLTSFSIPSGVTSIDDYAFSGCQNLASITLPDGVRSIGNVAFQNCNKFTSITLPAGITTFGVTVYTGAGDGGAFLDCTSLTSIINLNPVPVTICSNTFEDVDKIACTLYVPYGSKDAYENADVWKEFNVIELDRLSKITNITSTSDGVILEWDVSEKAAGYNILIYSDEARTDTLRIISLDAVGDLIQNTLFRSVNTSLHYNVTGLDSETEYFYTLQTIGTTGDWSLENQSGRFTTLLGTATGINEIMDEQEKTVIAYYSISGHRLHQEPQSGPYVVQYNNGRTEKKTKK